jgi:hypothetical protein
LSCCINVNRQRRQINFLKNELLRNKTILSKQGDLSPFTAIFEEWLNQVPNENSILFPSANSATGALNWNKPLGKNRVHHIIKYTNGMFPHWYRGVCETIYGKKY